MSTAVYIDTEKDTHQHHQILILRMLVSQLLVAGLAKFGMTACSSLQTTVVLLSVCSAYEALPQWCRIHFSVNGTAVLMM